LKRIDALLTLFSMTHATTCGRYIARKGTEQLSKRYFRDRVPSPRPIRGYAVVRAGLITIAWPFLLARRSIKMPPFRFPD
jgi:hypothetical protein